MENREIISQDETMRLIAYCKEAKSLMQKRLLPSKLTKQRWMDHQLMIIDTWLEARQLTINPYLFVECLRNSDITLDENQPRWNKK